MVNKSNIAPRIFAFGQQQMEPLSDRLSSTQAPFCHFAGIETRHRSFQVQFEKVK